MPTRKENNKTRPHITKMKFTLAAILLAFPTTVDAHGAMNEPAGPEGIINVACPRPMGAQGDHDEAFQKVSKIDYYFLKLILESFLVTEITNCLKH